MISMIMTKYDMYWKSNKEWWEYNEWHRPVIKKSAPKYAQMSYRHYREQIKREIERDKEE